MNQGQFVQVPCVKCGATVYISPAAGMGFCPSCHTQNQLPAGAVAGAPGAPPPGAPAPGAPPPAPGAAPPPAAGYGAPAPAFGRAGASAGGPSVFKAIGGGILAVVVGIGYVGFRFFVKGAVKSAVGVSGSESLSNLGIDQKKGDPDKMIAGAAAYAKKWKSDASFWSVTILGLGADGTVDLSDKNVVVEYFSPSAVSSPLQNVRNDSIKKFNFINDAMQYGDIWGVNKQYTPPPKGPPIPGCTAKKLAAILVKAGTLKQGQTVQVSIDPAFSETSWIVQTGGVPAHYDTATCAARKD